MQCLRNNILQISKQLTCVFNNFHTAPVLGAWANENRNPKKFLSWNKKIYPPQQPGEDTRPAYVCHMKPNIKYSPKKMWYVASFIRGMPVDEAIKQLRFVLKKGAASVIEALIEAKHLAVTNHNVEYASNLWVAESFVGKGRIYKGLRRHARGRVGRVEYKHVHYFVRLEEGKPPLHYYAPAPKDPSEQLEEWLEQMRKRKIISSL